MHHCASTFPCMYGFDGLRLRASARKHTSASTLPRLGGKAYPRIVGFVGFLTMIQPLVTDEPRARLLAVGDARAAGQPIEPTPVVSLSPPTPPPTWPLRPEE